MPNVAASIRIRPMANDLLNLLSAKLGQPKASVVERALEVLEERVYWEEVREAFAIGEPEEMRAERELWDSTANDGLAGKRW